MGKVKPPAFSLSATLLAGLSHLLDAHEREAVLGDLAEEGAGPLSAIWAVAGLAARRAVQRPRLGSLATWCSGDTLALVAEEPRPWPEWAIPLAFGLVAAVCVVALLVPSQARTLTWSSLISRSAWLLLGAAIAALSAVFLVHRGFRKYLGRPGATLLACAWSTAIWIPLLMLMWSQHALWVVLTPIPIAAILASFIKRRRNSWRDNSATHDAVARDLPKQLFDGATGLPTQSVQPIPLLCALLLEGAALAAAAGQISLTSSCVIVFTACLAWAFTPDRTTLPGAVSPRSRVAVLPCFLLTCLALTPFLRAGFASAELSDVVLAHPFAGAPRLVHVPGTVYSGVVLMAPPLPKRKLISAPPKTLLGGLIRPSRPLTIPFDGAFWYFQDPETRPRPDAEVKRGDPIKNHVHSSADWTPIKMEAHQRIGAQLDAGCCQSLDVALVNADTRRGLIEVEAKLQNITAKGTTSVSLGTVPVRSSIGTAIPLDRPRVSETLRFPLRGEASSFRFNEIALVFKLARERNLAGARVQVVKFTLEP